MTGVRTKVPATADRSEISPCWVRPKEWIRLTGMSRTATHRSLHDGSLRAVHIGRTWYIHTDELTAFFERNDQRAAA